MKDRLDSIEDAVEAIRRGEVIIVVDDEARENEGDFLTAARNVSPETINFMATYGRGLICAPLIEDRCDELGLELMVSRNSAQYETPFTVSVDLLGHGTTTGISASDRAKTVQALIHPDTRPKDLGKPGHIFPLRAKRGGVLRRAGHTEAAIDFARLAGFEPAGVIVEIMNEDGSMARLPQLFAIADRFNLKLVSIEDLIAYRLRHDSLIEKISEMPLATRYGDFRLCAFRQKTNDAEHFALGIGHWDEDEPIAVRVHTGNPLADIFAAGAPGKGLELHYALELIGKEGKGVVVYIDRHPGEKSLLQQLSNDLSGTAGGMDSRDYGIGAQILRAMGVRKMRLITDTLSKRTGIQSFGLEIVDHIPATPQ